MMDAMRPPSPHLTDGGRTSYLLPGGLTTIALAYPAVMATGNARMALAAGIFILVVPLLVWATRHALRQLARVHVRLRVCGGAGMVIFLHILYAGILWLILDATA